MTRRSSHSSRLRSRLLVGALCALGIGAWLGIGGGAGIAQAQERQKALPDLLQERNEAIHRYHETAVELSALDNELAAAEKALQSANDDVRRAEADGGPFRAQTVQKLRAKARAVAEEKVKLSMRHAELTPRHELQRVQLIEARSAYANRLMEVADRLGSDRLRNIREYTELALNELGAIANLRKAGQAASNLKPVVAPLGPYASLDDMQWRARAYERQIESFQSQLRELRPREKMIEKHVLHLDHLHQRGYALPELAQTLERERSELAQVQELRAAIETQTGYYGRLLTALRERIKASGEKPK